MGTNKDYHTGTLPLLEVAGDLLYFDVILLFHTPGKYYTFFSAK